MQCYRAGRGLQFHECSLTFTRGSDKRMFAKLLQTAGSQGDPRATQFQPYFLQQHGWNEHCYYPKATLPEKYTSRRKDRGCSFSEGHWASCDKQQVFKGERPRNTTQIPISVSMIPIQLLQLPCSVFLPLYSCSLAKMHTFGPGGSGITPHVTTVIFQQSPQYQQGLPLGAVTCN